MSGVYTEVYTRVYTKVYTDLIKNLFVFVWISRSENFWTNFLENKFLQVHSQEI